MSCIFITGRANRVAALSLTEPRRVAPMVPCPRSWRLKHPSARPSESEVVHAGAPLPCHLGGHPLPGCPAWHMLHPCAMLFGVAHMPPRVTPCSAGWPPQPQGGRWCRQSPRPRGGAGGLPWGGAALAPSPSALAAPPPCGLQQQWLRFCCLRPARAGPLTFARFSRHSTIRSGNTPGIVNR